MTEKSQSATHTDHAMLVVWGQFAHGLGLIQAIERVELHQKTVQHSPQSKVLEFLVAILGGLQYLKDISLSARPLDQDQAVAKAWGQTSWADHSGVSRTLSRLSAQEVEQIAGILERVSQAFIDQEVERGLASGPLVLDGDLTPRPVSNSSRTYPEAEYGHMNDRLQLGYQAGIVSMCSPTYGRIGLSACQHSGKTVSATQAEHLVLEAERRLRRRPQRRTALLAERIEQIRSAGQTLAEKVTRAQRRLAEVQAAQEVAAAQLVAAEQRLSALEADYAARHRPEGPYSRLSKARQQVAVCQRRVARRQDSTARAQRWLERQQARRSEWEAEKVRLEERLRRFETENAANPAPIEAIFRLDAGFGTPENLALLIEMGYQVYTKPYGNWLSGLLAEKNTHQETWVRVGANAEMLAWKDITLPDFPYPVDLGVARYRKGKSYSLSGLLHYGRRNVTADLPAWFHDYNARQTIEAGNKEGKQVFEVHHLKVRSRPALHLQEHFALFAANFVRFAAHWLAEQCPQVPDGWKNSVQPQVKNQVKVGAHTPALVEWLGQDCLVRFSDRSVFAGRTLTIRRQLAIQLTLPWKIAPFSPI